MWSVVKPPPHTHWTLGLEEEANPSWSRPTLSPEPCEPWRLEHCPPGAPGQAGTKRVTPDFYGVPATHPECSGSGTPKTGRGPAPLCTAEAGQEGGKKDKGGAPESPFRSTAVQGLEFQLCSPCAPEPADLPPRSSVSADAAPAKPPVLLGHTGRAVLRTGMGGGRPHLSSTPDTSVLAWLGQHVAERKTSKLPGSRGGPGRRTATRPVTRAREQKQQSSTARGTHGDTARHPGSRVQGPARAYDRPGAAKLAAGARALLARGGRRPPGETKTAPGKHRQPRTGFWRQTWACL